MIKSGIYEEMTTPPFTLKDGRPYVGVICFNHGKNNKGERVRVVLQRKTITEKDKRSGKEFVKNYAYCPKCHVHIEVIK